ncbi:hypothetical protein D9M69_354910 [compost metagenome]
MVGRHLVPEPGPDRFPGRRVRGHGLLVAVAPAGDLALHVAFRLAQVTQAAGLVVDVVQLHQLVDEALAQFAGLAFGELHVGRQVGAQDHALDPFHHVELGADHRLVGAVHVGLGAVGEAGVELVEDAEFAAHVVGGFGLAPEGRAAQHELLAGVFQQVGQVRGAAGELADARGAFQAGDVGLEVLVDDGGVELFAFADAGGLISKRHAYPFCL